MEKTRADIHLYSKNTPYLYPVGSDFSDLEAGGLKFNLAICPITGFVERLN